MCRYCLVLSLLFPVLYAAENPFAVEKNIQKIEQEEHNLLSILKKEQQKKKKQQVEKADKNTSKNKEAIEVKSVEDHDASGSEANDANLTDKRGSSGISPKKGAATPLGQFPKNSGSQQDGTQKSENNITKITSPTTIIEKKEPKPATIDASKTKAKVLEAQLLGAIKEVGSVEKEIEAIDRKIEKLQEKLKTMQEKIKQNQDSETDAGGSMENELQKAIKRVQD